MTNRTRLLILAVVAIALVTLIGVAKSWPAVTAFDRSLMLETGALRATPTGDILTPPALMLTVIGDTIGRLFLMFGVCAYLYRRKQRRTALWMVGIVIGVTMLNNIFKTLWAVPRPDLIPHLDPIRTFSFPSGHASGNMAFFCAVALLVRRWWFWIPAIAFALAIGWSRLWLGVHWPTDIVAGWILGVGWLCAWTALVPLRGSQSRA